MFHIDAMTKMKIWKIKKKVENEMVNFIAENYGKP